MQGYAFNWEHKAPKTIIPDKSETYTNIISNSPNALGSKKSNIALLKESYYLSIGKLIQPKSKVSNPIAEDLKEQFSITPEIKTVLLDDSLQQGQTKREVCIQAKRSLHFGILTWGIPIAAILLALLALSAFPATSSGGCLSTGAIIGIVIVLFALPATVVMSVLAMVNGENALDKIKKEPEKYWGKGKAIAGILLGFLPLFAAILIWLLHLY